MKWKKILPLIGILIFIYLVYKIGFSEIASNFKNIHYGYFFIAILLAFAILLFQTFRWMLILKEQKIYIPFRKAFKFYLISVFYGLITPAKIGSLMRVPYMKEEVDNSWAECASSIILERIFDLLILFSLAIIGTVVLSEYVGAFLPVLILAIFAFIISCFILLNKKLTRIFLKRFVYIIIPARFKRRTQEVFDAFYNSLPRLRRLILPFLFTFFLWVMLYTQTYFVAKSFGVNVPWIIFLVVVPIVTLVTLLPISISGIGTREITFVYLFGFFGVAQGTVLTFSVVTFLLNAIVPIIVVLSSMRESLKK
ncbi:MAG: flippase-like domain-containing protein [Nanoarchaeota archaeon]|nr:flippase-like domain-containing protein [Nanoarchaeota archaeon]